MPWRSCCCDPGPAAAGIGDWWDIYSGAAETEIRRLNRQADVGLAWHHSRRLFEVQEALYFAIHGLKPPQIEALIENLDDPNRTLDDLRLPSKDGRHTLTARQTREQLGLPPDGLEREGIAVIRGFDRLVVYHDMERRGLVRFGQEDDSAQLLLSTLHQDIRRNPPVPKHIQKIGSQVRQHSPHLIKDGKMLWHHGAENEGCKPVLDRLPQTPTIGLCAVYMPTKSRRNERVADCPGDQVGGVFETVHLINGEESRRSKRWDDCVAKPPVEQSRFRWVGHPDRKDCRKALYDARYALHANGIRNYRITGQYREERKEWSYREDFPPEWSLPPLVLTWNDPWIVKRDTCRLTWDTAGSENGRYRVGQCAQDRRRSLTYHWQQSRTSGRRPANPPVTRGSWRDVGRADCPYNNFTTTETETGTYKVNGCTQRRQRTVTSHWRQSARPGSKRQLRYKTNGPWRDVGSPRLSMDHLDDHRSPRRHLHRQRVHTEQTARPNLYIPEAQQQQRSGATRDRHPRPMVRRWQTLRLPEAGGIDHRQHPDAQFVSSNHAGKPPHLGAIHAFRIRAEGDPQLADLSRRSARSRQSTVHAWSVGA